MANTKKTSYSNLMFGDESRAKRLVFGTVCGNCGRRFRRALSMQTGYLCKDCRPAFDKVKIKENDSICSICIHQLDCAMRASVGVWVRCESPDAADVIRLIDTLEGHDEQRTSAALVGVLAGSRNRQVLETKVSKSVAKILER